MQKGPQMLLCALAAFLCVANAAGVQDEGWKALKPAVNTGAPTVSPPIWPKAFTVSYVFSMPYVRVVQTRGLRFPVTVSYDGDADRLAVSVFGGLDKTITNEEGQFLIFPRLHKSVCWEFAAPAGPTSNGKVPVPLPDLTNWSYGGTTSVGNAPAHVWTYSHKDYDKVSSYTFYTSPGGAPLRLSMLGFNILAGSHFDEYLFDFTHWQPGAPPASAFKAPKHCKSINDLSSSASVSAGAGSSDYEEFVDQTAEELRASLAARMWQSAALLPGGTLGRIAANTLASQQLLARRAAAAEHLQLVRSHDSSAAGYSVGLNRFAGMLEQEFVAAALGRLPTARSTRVKAQMTLGTLKKTMARAQLPKSVDWRGTIQDQVVKDQATCGSCWAFSATGTMQGAWALATGSPVSLSEQALVDCSWKYGNNGCGGGLMEPAIQYVADAGGIPAEEDYQYRGNNMYCGANATRRDAPPAAHFEGFANVKPRDKEALMEAVYRYGPVAISIDASWPTFRFYTQGVYSEPRCFVDPDHMDHAVLLVGYGTTDDGKDYWIVKNSWSKMWGSDGYILMARTPGDKNDCGVTTDPVVAVVSKSHVVQGRPYGPVEFERPLEPAVQAS